MPNFLKISQLQCQYDEKTVLNDLNFTLDKGELAALLGPSGCGKSTLLRAIAGFEKIQNGQIEVNQTLLSSPSVSIPPEKRKIGMVFQDYALFPHLTIEQNIAYGLDKQQAKSPNKRIEKLLDLIDLSQHRTRYPHELSGGQQQRVALARALAPEPELILFDEPFSNLDADLRTRLGGEVRQILKDLNTSAILVTHDQSEAFAMADKIGVIQQGKVIQTGSANQLYHQPKSKFVAQFIGKGSFISGKAVNESTIETSLGQLNACSANGELVEGENVELLVRPEAVTIDTSSSTQATITGSAFAGGTTYFSLSVHEIELEISLGSQLDLQVGQTIPISLANGQLIAFKTSV
ncbi:MULTISPECIES: ABC transporter ATP-binding protein [unclassified Oleiphilus]|nr:MULTISPECIES: ABC transporter ATP-binding protein [unclassified Oleiphilus]KZY64568.1 hypothetical protein A3738_10145 [Oleiphilus sp. HI0066]KZY68630.1 hypothetical protein A3739_10885 [Oleiphilus sp. HI0067]KZZ57555.1 hypothetical protein A3762_09730 [Oleiphilus sp. HI0125]MCH2159330.1 ABC transporter ATP-binding protein [Oleiphilaceae bacterium]